MTSPIRRIIIVDDHDAIRRGVRQLLETKPYYQVVGEASDGRSGLELARESRPDIAILDYSIPELHGLPLGDTEFASAAAAWDALPDAMKRSLEGRRAVFDFRGRKRALTPTQAEIDRNPPVHHPIVRTHPRTGRKCLYVMRDDCTAIEGISPDEAEALIAALADHIIKPAFVYRHQWRPGDVLMWDNCMVQHRAIQDYDMPQRRLMHRTTMGGAVPA